MRIKLYHKITIVLALTLALVLSVIYAYLNNNLRQYTYQRIKNNLDKDTGLLRSFLEKTPPDMSSAALDEFADIAGRDLNARVTIIGTDGNVLGDSEIKLEDLAELENHINRPEVEEALASGSGESERFSTTVQDQRLYMASIFGRPEARGVIRLSVPLSELAEVSGYLKRIAGLSFVLVFILTLIFGAVGSFFISHPLKQISDAAKEISRGDFSRRILVNTRDEVEDLATTFNDMSDQIKARIEDVTDSRSRLEAVFASMFDGVIIVDAKCRILIMNRAIRDLLSVKEDPVGRKPLEVIRNVKVQELADSVLGAEGKVGIEEISVLLPEEKKLLVHATSVIKNDKVEGAVLVFHDITDMRRLERVRQDFVANVSHELRTPITNIKGYAETLLDGALGDKDNAEEFIRIIYNDSERLANLIEDLLDLSSIESGKLALELAPCSIKDLAGRVVADIEQQANDKGIYIGIDVPDGMPAILADERLIYQALMNIVDNAVKYTEDKGSIRINAKSRDGFTECSVSDTGIGIPEQDLPRIFERFYRVDKARSRKIGGTGLGLSIVKHIIQEHGGQVFVESAPGKGSVFTFTIPNYTLIS
ncbi:MAG: ATP-binding protein [Candidatus Omnitrophica bacterium]|nr:ATP-binding protein [Candidatus Omnitrophota bacterium]MDD5488612.1 ATP-binding protein [Candidatus Omnitrophota bacterium]